MKWIDNIVLGLLDKYCTNDIYELCEFENIKIIKLDSSNAILRNTQALYYRDLNDEEIIFVKNNLDYRIEEFILKHELGHALLHPNLLRSTYTYGNIGKYEKQANYFALKLSNITFDEIELEGMTLEQVASCLNIPIAPFKQLVNL